MQSFLRSISEVGAEEEVGRCLRILRSLALSVAPAILASLFLPARACVLATMIAVVICYNGSSMFQQDLFRLPLNASESLIAMPMHLLVAVWGVVLIMLHRHEQLATLFSILALALTAIAPVYRRNESVRTARRLPYPLTYCLVALLVMAVQVYMLWVTP
jgi:hypothetical protein